MICSRLFLKNMEEKILKMLEEINCNLVAIKVNQNIILDELKNKNKNTNVSDTILIEKTCPTTVNEKIESDYSMPKYALYNDNMKPYVYG